MIASSDVGIRVYTWNVAAGGQPVRHDAAAHPAGVSQGGRSL